MDAKTIFFIVVIIVLVVIIFCLIFKINKIKRKIGQDYVKLDEKLYINFNQKEVNKIIKKLRYEERCKNLLIHEIELMFFFKEFKNSKKMKEHFENKRKRLLSYDKVDDERMAKIKMYEHIINGIDKCLNSKND